MNLILGAVPLQVNANVAFAFPVSSDFVVLAEYFVEMLGMFTPDIFYTKIIDS
jgi:hypothetical protein